MCSSMQARVAIASACVVCQQMIPMHSIQRAILCKSIPSCGWLCSSDQTSPLYLTHYGRSGRLAGKALFCAHNVNGNDHLVAKSSIQSGCCQCLTHQVCIAALFLSVYGKRRGVG